MTELQVCMEFTMTIPSLMGIVLVTNSDWLASLPERQEEADIIMSSFLLPFKTLNTKKTPKSPNLESH